LIKNNESLKSQLEDFQKRHEFNEIKIAKYIEKLDQFQVEKLNLELDISKNNSELMRIKQEVTEFNDKLMKKDYKISELQNKLENFLSLETQKASFLDSPPKNLRNELNGFISEIFEKPVFNCNNNLSNLEKLELQNDDLQQKEKEIKHLMEKCKELQNENSEFRMKLELEIKTRGEKLNEEIKKTNYLNKSSFNEMKRENKKIAEELLKMNEVIF